MIIVPGIRQLRSSRRFSLALFRMLAASLFVLPLTSTGARAGDLVPPKVEATTPGGMAIQDGSLSFRVTDLSIGPLTLERFLQTLLPNGATPVNFPFFGKGMTSNYDIYVAPNFTKPLGPPWNTNSEYHPIVHLGSGASGVYLQGNPRGAVYELNLDARAGILAWSGTAYTYTDKTGAVYSFDPAISAGGASGLSQRVSSIAFPDGRVQTFTYFSYGGNSHLKMVSDSSGYAIVFDYYMDGDAKHDGYVSAACGFDLARDYVTSASTCTSAALKVGYDYTAGALTSSTDVTGQVTTYTGVGPGMMGCLKPPGYAVCKLQSGGGGILLADGSSWSVITDAVINMNDPEASGANGSSSMLTDAAGKISWWTFSKGSPTSVSDANGNVTTYRFLGAVLEEPWFDQTVTDGTMLMEATFPEGNKYLAEYLGPYNSVSKRIARAKPGSGIADQVETFGYSCPGATLTGACTKPTSTVDAKGNQTDFTYASWGGMLTEMQPSPIPPSAWTGSTPAIDKARPLKVNTYVQKYAYIKNAGGSLAAAAAPVWLPATETLCQTVSGSSTPVCDTGAPITVTTYEYGANGTADNLLLRGKVVTSGGVSLRTCYGYDAWGNKIWETSPRGTTSASCS